MDLWAKLKERGITLRNFVPGEHQTTCPDCSHLRKPHNRKKPVLSVKVESDRAYWTCHHCSFKGAVFLSDQHERSLIKPRKPTNVAKENKPRRWW